MSTQVGVKLIPTIMALCCLLVAPGAKAQISGQFTDGPVVTVASAGSAAQAVGYCSATSKCFYGYSGAFGSISPATTVDGYTLEAFVDLPGTARAGTTYLRTAVSVSGFPADPGYRWLTSASANGHTYYGSSASSYAFTNGQATWYWNSGSGAVPAFQNQPSPVSCTIYHSGNSGWIRPKYQVVGLTYAPPGSKSTATYTNGFLSGTSTSSTASFNVNVLEKLTVSTGFTLFGVLNGDATQTFSAGWIQQQDNSSSITVMQKESTGLIVPGPASSGVGVDHDYDEVYVWLNPDAFLEITSNLVNVGAYGYDARDTVTGMDVMPLTVGQLKGTQPISADAQARLNRTWDSSLGALTSADFQQILKADPFATNPSFNPNTDASGRYELPEIGSPPAPTNLIFNYVPLPPGGQATGQPYTSDYSSTSVAGRLAKDTYSVGYSIDGSASAAFLAAVSTKSSSSVTYTYSNQWSSSVTSGTTQSANFTIYPPLASDNYTGPTAIQVWKDNVYGTFMFYPEN
jgi:hypothetical protein